MLHTFEMCATPGIMHITSAWCIWSDYQAACIISHRHVAQNQLLHEAKTQLLQLLSLDNFRPATLAEVCAVHDQRYPEALLRIAEQQQPAQHTLVEGAPTYVTSTSYDDAIQVCRTMPAANQLSIGTFHNSTGACLAMSFKICNASFMSGLHAGDAISEFAHMACQSLHSLVLPLFTDMPMSCLVFTLGMQYHLAGMLCQLYVWPVQW